jgi:hypothetical protein
MQRRNVSLVFFFFLRIATEWEGRTGQYEPWNLSGNCRTNGARLKLEIPSLPKALEVSIFLTEQPGWAATWVCCTRPRTRSSAVSLP